MARKAVSAAEATLKARASTLGSMLSDAFQARQAAARTPAEQALAAMQDAHDAAQRQQALADAQAQLSSAQTDEERLNAQRAVADAQYAIQVAALQRQADTERTALDQKQKDEQRAFDNSLKALTTYLNSAHATAAGARIRINKLMRQFGLDFATIGSLLGSNFADGLAKQESAVAKAATKLANAVKTAIRDGLKIGSPSKVMMSAGRDVSRGLALGMTQNAGLVDRAFSALLPSADIGGTIVNAAAPNVDVRVYLGDQELRGMVRAEIATDNTRLARGILAGVR
jgi:hypothetical protein